MKKKRGKIYVYGDALHNKMIYTGISFGDFIASVKPPIENLMLLKGDYLEGCRYDKCNFVSIEGNKNIEEFLNEDIYLYGDFHWID